MKQLFLLFFILSSFLFAEERTLRISNFIDYIDIELLKDFASKNNIKIKYDIHDANESIFEKLEKDNDYDLCILSSNYITKLKKINKIDKIDISKLENYPNINQDFLQNNFINSTEYTIPYLWGNGWFNL